MAHASESEFGVEIGEVRRRVYAQILKTLNYLCYAAFFSTAFFVLGLATSVFTSVTFLICLFNF